MNPKLLILVFSIITSQTISAQESEVIGEPLPSNSPIQSQDFTLTDTRAFKDDTLGDERLMDENKPLTFNITGKAKVVDGDTITINNTKIRFSGIDAPESYYYGQTQYCKKPNGNIWACGKKATSKLKKLINKQVVKCTDEGKDRYGRTLSICFVNDLDLQSEMVRSGMAIAYLKYSRRYEQEMIEAMNNKVGIWSGNFLDPEDWRRANSVRD